MDSDQRAQTVNLNNLQSVISHLITHTHTQKKRATDVPLFKTVRETQVSSTPKHICLYTERSCLFLVYTNSNIIMQLNVIIEKIKMFIWLSITFITISVFRYIISLTCAVVSSVSHSCSSDILHAAKLLLFISPWWINFLLKVKNSDQIPSSNIRYPRLGLKESGWERRRREIYVSYLHTDDVKVLKECDFIGEMRPSKVERVLLEGESLKKGQKNEAGKKASD